MRVCVAGLWHLGVVTAACVAAARHDVVGFDEERGVIEGLEDARLPVSEPGLSELLRAQVAEGRLKFTNDPGLALRGADLLWIAYDTPVGVDDRGDVEFVVQRARALVDAADPATTVIVSSQLPVGTTRMLARGRDAESRIAYSPENLRLGNSIEAFTRPARIVVGIDSDADRRPIEELLRVFTDHIEWMRIESAELTKHGLNTFLATSVAFANELAGIAASVGADATEVERGLKSDERIGRRAYLRPGAAFAGGTLGRDLEYLTQLGAQADVETQLLAAVRRSNDAHKQWPRRMVSEMLRASDGKLEGHTIGVWGLVYTPGTDTLRRSSSIDLCHALVDAGATVRAHDAAVRTLPAGLELDLTLCETPLEAVTDASALVVETNWPQYREIEPDRLLAVMRTPNVVDANGFLQESLGNVASLSYVQVGTRGR